MFHERIRNWSPDNGDSLISIPHSELIQRRRGIIAFDADTRREMIFSDFPKLRIKLRAFFNRPGAARPETASGRRVDRRRNIALQDDSLAFYLRVWNRNRRKQAPAYMDEADLVKFAAILAISTISPRYITATRVEICSTTARPCEMKR